MQVEALRVAAERDYVGFPPNTYSVKPVHIANGLFRFVHGKTYDTSLLNRFVFWQKADGTVPPKHRLEVVSQELVDLERIDSSISPDQIAHMRRFLKKVVDADNGVFLGTMASYTSGTWMTLSNDTIGQEGGEFVGAWLHHSKSPLLHQINACLENGDDIISTLVRPLVMGASGRVHCAEFDFGRVRAFKEPPDGRVPLSGLAEAAETLALHLKSNPNKLSNLRLITLFASFAILRYMADLDYLYSPGKKVRLPFVLDFTGEPSSPMAQASRTSYVMVTQSIARFYSWAMGEELKKALFTVEDAMKEQPQYRRGKISDDAKQIWDLGVKEAMSSEDPYKTLGQALYDIIARESSSNPVSYLRQLGHRSGILYPPTNTYPTKRFAIQQDVLEMLIRGAVKPMEHVDMSTLQERLWRLYGIVVGGHPTDDSRLLASGIYQADSDALLRNKECFALALKGLDFAYLLADGVLKIGLGGLS